MDNALTHENFTNYLNTTFQVELDTEAIPLSLTEISAVRATESQEQFSIIFRGPLDHALPQGIHRFRHDQMGEFDLFIVPIKRGAEAYQYEAVFNRLAARDQPTS
ncbi:MAG TPA: hypothetical protein VIT88_14375 [Pyrinomonadaceae bacterium]